MLQHEDFLLHTHNMILHFEVLPVSTQETILPLHNKLILKTLKVLFNIIVTLLLIIKSTTCTNS